MKNLKTKSLRERKREEIRKKIKEMYPEPPNLWADEEEKKSNKKSH